MRRAEIDPYALRPERSCLTAKSAISFVTKRLLTSLQIHDGMFGIL